MILRTKVGCLRKPLKLCSKAFNDIYQGSTAEHRLYAAASMGKGKRLKLDTAKPSKQFKQREPPKMKPASKPEIFIPFAPEDRIMLVGEGDFSFAKSIVEEHGCYDVIATCLDGRDELFGKYDPQAEEHVKFLEEAGSAVLYNVDATKLDANKALKKGPLFDRIIFNFPHIGGKSKDVNRQVRFNQELIVKFFGACSPLLSPEGTIIVTLFEGEPYTLWNIRDLARHSGLEVVRSFRFVADAYPGYSHARTLGNIDGGGGWKGEDREARSYIFRRKTTPRPTKSIATPQPVQHKRKRRRSHDSSDEDN